MVAADTLRLTLIRAKDDDASSSSPYQAELRQFFNLVRAEGTKISAAALTSDSIGGGGYTGEFLHCVGASDRSSVQGRGCSLDAGPCRPHSAREGRGHRSGGKQFGRTSRPIRFGDCSRRTTHQPPRPAMSDTALAVRTSAPLPAVVLGAGERVSIRFVEFFASNIRNANTLRVEDVYVQNRLLWVRQREKGAATDPQTPEFQW